jgi:hypothetical protein
MNNSVFMVGRAFAGESCGEKRVVKNSAWSNRCGMVLNRAMLAECVHDGCLPSDALQSAGKGGPKFRRKGAEFWKFFCEERYEKVVRAQKVHCV